MRQEELRKRINQYSRVNLISLPTPLMPLENLLDPRQNIRLFIKRDDLTGLAFGGNKSRKLELIMADVLAKKADVLITWASLQSNWCLQTAAAARKLGIKPVLILFKTYDLPEEIDGNVLLDFILEAEIQIREARRGKIISEEEVAGVIEEVQQQVLEWGHKPYIAPIGGSIPGFSMELPLGAIAYVQAGIEIFEQLAEEKVKPTWIVHASGSGGTQAGLVVAAKILSPETKVLGICVSDPREKFHPEVLLVARETVKALDLDITIAEEDIILTDDYLGEGYGILTPEIAQTIRLVAQKEAIFLDPVYTGKAMWGLLDLIEKGYFQPNDRIVFVHTGGTAVLFPHRQGFQSWLT